jgi:aspartate/methionine/tyrosine aminotransferase
VTVAAIEDFALERYFARWEFAVKHQLSASDVEPLTLREVLALADDQTRGLWDGLALGYTESSGHPLLRAEIAQLYQQLGPEHVLVLAGAEEGIFLATQALVSSGDEAVVVIPAYQSLHAVPRSVGARVRTVELRAEHGWRLDVDEVARAVSPRTRVIAINFPHNPTGAHIGRAEQQRLVEIADSVGAVLLADEVYRGLEYGAEPALPPAADLSERAVSLGVMSKSFALAGLRIGWLATRNAPLLERIAKLKDYTTICSSAPSEVLALIALRARERILERSRDIVGRNLAQASRFFADHSSELEWIAPRAGSVAFPRFARRDAEQVARQLAEHASVLLVPGSIFDAPRSHFRLGLGRRDLPEALGALGALLAGTV